MSAKPTIKTEWCSAGDTAEAPPGKKAVGFVPGERLSSQGLNHLLKVISDWIDFVDSKYDGTADADEIHPDRPHAIAPWAFVETTSSVAPQRTIGKLEGTGAFEAYAPLTHLRPGDRIKNYTTHYNRGGNTIVMRIERVALADGTDSTVTPVTGTATDSSSSGDTSKTQTFAHVVEVGYCYLARFDGGSGTDLYGAVVTHDRPV